MNEEQYQKCIDACIECATACSHCAVSCLEEKDVQYLTKCIRLNLECAIICRATAELMSTGSNYSSQLGDLCATVSNACAEICEQHANMGMEHCQECALACRACAKELMEFIQNTAQQQSDSKSAMVFQDECAILSRASSELMSLDSAYCNQICALTATVCKAASETLDTNLNNEINYSKQHALISNEAQKHLENLEQSLRESDGNESEGNNEKSVQKKEAKKSMSKHSTALLAASMWHSPVHNSLRHSSGGLGGRYANMGTNISYEEEDK